MTIAIVLGCAIAAILASAWGSAHVLGVWVFVLLVHGMLVYFFGESLQQLSMIVGLLAVMLAILGKRSFDANLISVGLILGFLLAIVMSFLVTWGDASTLTKVVTYLKPLMVCFLLSGILRSHSDLYVISTYILAAAVVGSLFNIYQQFTGTHVNMNTWDRALSRSASLRADPNDTAMLLLSALPLAYLKILNTHRFRKALWLAVAGLIVIGTVLTGSRGGFLVLVLIVLALIIHKPRGSRSILGAPSLRKVLAILVLAIAGLVLAPSYYWERMETLVSGKEVGQSASLYSRKQLLERGIDAWLASPVLGVGPGQYHSAIHGSDMLAPGEAGKLAVAHNMYLEYLVEFGLVGFSFFLLIAIASIFRFIALDLRVQSTGVFQGLGFSYALGLGAMLLMGMTLSQGYNPVMWFFLGLGLAVTSLSPAAATTSIRRDEGVAISRFNFQ